MSLVITNLHFKRGLRLLTSALLAGYWLSGCAGPNRAASQPAHARELAQIRQRLEQIMAAAESKDFNRLDSYHLYNQKFSKFAGSSPNRLDAELARKGEHDGLGAAQGLKMRADALKIDLFGQTGIATFILEYSVDSVGQRIYRKDRATLVFVRDGGEWKIAHEHLSTINP